MVKVLFVCLGNICRSPLAEGIFKNLIKENGLEQKIICDSAGTGAYHIGKDPDHRSCTIALKHQIKLDHKARQFTVSDFEIFDYILAMDEDNLRNIKKLAGKAFSEEQVMLMNKFDLHASCMDVPDPYYGALGGFQEVYDMLQVSCSNLLAFIQEKHQL